MISSPRFGNIHVLEPLVYERFRTLLSASKGKNAYASPTTEPTNPAMNFLSDVSKEEDVRDGFDNKLWQIYNLPNNKAMLLTNWNGGHYNKYREFRDRLKDESPQTAPVDVAQAYLDSQATQQKINVIKDAKTPNLSLTGLHGEVLTNPVYQAAYKRFLGCELPPEIAEYWASRALDRFEFLGDYMPRMIQVFGIAKDPDSQDDFVAGVTRAIKVVFGGKFLSARSNHFAKPFESTFFKRLEVEGYPVKDVSGYADETGASDTESDRRWSMEVDVMCFAERLIRLDHPMQFVDDDPPKNPKEPWE